MNCSHNCADDMVKGRSVRNAMNERAKEDQSITAGKFVRTLRWKSPLASKFFKVDTLERQLT